jgi:hypothetical protein
MEKIRTLIEQEESATLLRMGKPRTTLERLFLRETQIDKK